MFTPPCPANRVLLASDGIRPTMWCSFQQARPSSQGPQRLVMLAGMAGYDFPHALGGTRSCCPSSAQAACISLDHGGCYCNAASAAGYTWRTQQQQRQHHQFRVSMRAVPLLQAGVIAATLTLQLRLRPLTGRRRKAGRRAGRAGGGGVVTLTVCQSNFPGHQAWWAPQTKAGTEPDNNLVAAMARFSGMFSRSLHGHHQRATDKAQEAAQLRGRIAMLRANIVRQRQEIDQLSQELSGLELPQAETESLSERLTKSIGVLVTRVMSYRDPWSFVYEQTGTALRVASETAASGVLMRDVLPNAPTLLTHAPGIYARATQLDGYMPAILPVLDGYLPLVEPHLETLIERFDDIEPHIPFCLQHIDIVVQHMGDLLEHLDDILLFAANPEVWQEMEPMLLLFVTRVKSLGPHMRPLYTHLRYLRPHFRPLARHIDRLTPHIAISSNADVLLFWFGWLLRVPGLHRLIAVPGVGAALSWLGPRLPRRFMAKDEQAADAGRTSQTSTSDVDPSRACVQPLSKTPRTSLSAAAYHVLLTLRTHQEEGERQQPRVKWLQFAAFPIKTSLKAHRVPL